MSAQQLNTKFGIENHLSITEDKPNFPKVTIKLESGTSCEIYLYGAHLTSFKTHSGREIIMMSSAAIFKEGKGIRGGIPVIFPQFGSGSLPQHGFARQKNWTIKESKFQDSNQVSITLLLNDDEETRKLWPHAFLLELSFRLYYTKVKGSVLEMEFSVANQNSSPHPFSFTTALHTYFKIRNINKTVITGLSGLSYFDKVKNEKAKEESKALKIVDETDRIYFNAPSDITIEEEEVIEKICFGRNNFNDVVVWNAWAAKAKSMEDLGDDDWKEYVCVESAVIGEPIELDSNKVWRGILVIGTIPIASAL